MRNRWKKWISILTITALVLTGCGKSNNKNQTETASGTKTSKNSTAKATILSSVSTKSKVVVDTEFTASDLEVGYEEGTATKITLNGNTIKVSGEGAAAKESVLTINKKGTYVITGKLNNGQIVVDAKEDDKVRIVLDGASITCNNNAPIYIKNADKTFITLKDKTENTLADGAEYVQADDTDVDAVIFSKADLTINGSGTLNVQGKYKHGIASKDDLVITGGVYKITAVNDALNGKDCVKIKDGTFLLSVTDGNGIQSKNGDDTTKGFVYICGGKITVSKCQEGIEGTAIIIADGTIDITAEDDGLNSSSGSSDTSDGQTAQANPSGNQNAKQRTDQSTANKAAEGTTGQTTNKAAGGTTGQITNKAAGGTTGQTTNKTAGGTTGKTANKAAGGTTGKTTDKAAGNTTGQSAGNTANGTDGPGQWGKMPGGHGGPGGGGFGGGEDPFKEDTNCYISITGGEITVNALGDGIDSNGCIYISGGSTYVSGPTNGGNGGLDYNGTADITAGTVIVAGSTGMAQGFSDTSTQYSLLYNLTSVCEAGTEVKLTDESGKVIVTYKPEKQYQSVVISTPDLAKDKKYTLTCGSQKNEITLSSVATSNGQQGMGGMHGGGGWMPGQNGMPRPDGANGQMPGKGQMPDSGARPNTDGTQQPNTQNTDQPANDNTTGNNQSADSI